MTPAAIIRTSHRSRPAAPARRRGFTLVELIIAILVLGIGLVLLAAIFPAGIAQQQFSNDDVFGRVVADHALSVIRSKVGSDDFGTFEQFYLGDARATGASGDVELPHRLGTQAQNAPFTRGISGDWTWKRPGFVFDDPSTPFDEGKIDIFSWEGTRLGLGVQPQLPLGGGESLLPIDGSLARATEFVSGRDAVGGDPYAYTVPSMFSQAGRHRLYGIPYNREKYDSDIDARTAETQWVLDGTGAQVRGAKEPAAFIFQAERTWPQVAGSRPGPGQYFWECMFRRFGGKMYVAVFVYRVAPPGGEPRHYSVSRASINPALLGQPQGNQNLPPLPVTLRLDNTSNQGGAKVTWPTPTSSVAATDIAPGTAVGSAFNAGAQHDSWQLPGQFILDNFNNVHRVIGGRRVPANGPVRFARPIPATPTAPSVRGMATGPSEDEQPSARIDQVWFLPGRDAAGNLLIPVFCTVQEL